MVWNGSRKLKKTSMHAYLFSLLLLLLSIPLLLGAAKANQFQQAPFTEEAAAMLCLFVGLIIIFLSYGALL